MKKIRHTICLVTAILVLAAAAVILTGCGGSGEIDTTGMYLVIYDGNGGYLGNKAAQVRKLFCSPGSKIPDYPVDYTENQYTVPSLGLAMRDGYQLLGWYSSATYKEDASGEYIYLALEDGSGVYEERADGKYVRNYIKDENGEYIFVYVENAPAAEEGAPAPTYVFIAQDAEEGAPDIGIEPGFYICNGAETINDIDNDEVRNAYRKAYDTKIYTKAQAESRGGWHLVEELGAEDRALYSALPRYIYTFTEATEEDAALDHYELVSDYASLYSVFTEDDAGDYVFCAGNYEKLNGEEEHDSGTRYSVNRKYVFSSETTKGAVRYEATMDYWDFANMTVTEDDCTWDGEKYVLTLYAHWEKKNTVYYHYENGTGKVDESTKKLLADNITYIPLMPGDTIGKKEIVPGYVGHTFLCWSKTQGEYDPWDFANDVFPEGSSELHLYAYYIEGTYTRVSTVKGLSDVGKNPAGSYLLVSDIDLSGTEYTSSPLGLSENSVFTGEFISFGHKITGLTYKLSPSKKYVGSSDILGTALFPNVCNARIEGVGVEATYVISGLSSKDDPSFKEDIKIYCSGLIGTVLETSGDVGGKTVIANCSVDLKVIPKTAAALNSNAYRYVIDIGDFVAYGEDNTLTSGCVSTVDCSQLKGSLHVSVKTYSEE
ncbi:MAG: hypothetical protein J5940_04955 [Clostridia bacterium]|nr:hypothetical protein [Clostridia bacterium]